MVVTFDKLMSETLSYPRYLAQGGDWGAAVSSWLGFDHAPRCCAVHLNAMTMRPSSGPETP